MTKSSNTPIVLLCVAASFVLAACDYKPVPSQPPAKATAPKVVKVAKKTAKPAAKVVKKVAKKPKFAYSPFVLRVKSDGVFKSMSFKDVGSHIGEKNAAVVYETLAEALSMEVSTTSILGMHAHVTYDKSNLDPSNHLACGSDRIYIDFWKSEKPAKWGYSLWSGCGEDDNFAWKELPYTPSKNKDLTKDIAPLAKSIVASIKAAKSKNCFQKSC